MRTELVIGVYGTKNGVDSGGGTTIPGVWTKLDDVIPVPFDIKPQNCRNPLNVKSGGVMPAAILGTEDLDVTQIDSTTIKLVGVSPLRWNVEDVATPFEPYTGKEDAYDCTTEGSDSYNDLTMKFKKKEIVEAIGDVNDGDVLILTVNAQLFDGTAIVGEDIVVILK